MDGLTTMNATDKCIINMLMIIIIIMIIILFIVLILLANSFNFCLTAWQAENSKEFCFIVLMQYTSNFVFRASA